MGPGAQALFTGEYEPSPVERIRNQVVLYESTGGTEGNTLEGAPRGHFDHHWLKIPQSEEKPVMRIKEGGVYVVAASTAGAPKHPSWYGNLVAHPEVLLQDGNEVHILRAREIFGEEKQQWWQVAERFWPHYPEYRERAAAREIPLILLEASFIRTDVAKEADVKAAVDFAVKTYGRLDAAFNNAGIETASPLDQITEEQYQNTFHINVWGVLCSMKHEVAAVQKTGGGAIVNTSSAFGLVGAAYASIYVGTKFAVEGLTRSIAVEVAKQNIRVNAVAPGAVQTDMIDRFAGKKGEARDDLIAKHPIGRFGTSEEIAAAVLYLCSDAASFTIGSTLSVDGGYRAW